MIEANKSRVFGAGFERHVRGRVEGAFARIFVHGVDAVREAVQQQPVLVVSNHSSWWDAMIALHVVTHLLAADGYAMMDAKNLRRLPFFGKVGAFGVDLDSPRDGARAIQYAAGLLDRARRLVWVFAQGRELPASVRPLGFRGGAAHIARRAGSALVVPCALRYELAEDPEPWCYVSFGPAVLDPTTAALEAGVVAELERAERAIVLRGAGDFELHFAKQPGRTAAWMEEALARITRP